MEKYLDKCIDSIANQTYRNLEIILVDDGSPDRCPEICDEWARKDTRIKVIHKHNGGLSSARNAGLDAAKGEYIGFIDSDDYAAPNMYEFLYRLLQDNNADLSICSFCNIDIEGNMLPSHDTADEIISGEQALEKAGWFSSSCNKLYKAEIFSSLRYNEGYIHEDEYIIHHVLGSCRKIAISGERLYFRLVRNDSIMGSIREESFDTKYFPAHMLGWLYAWKDRYDYFAGMGRADLAESMFMSVYYTLSGSLGRMNYMQYRKELNKYLPFVMKHLLMSKSFRDKARFAKITLKLARSIFRPYIKEAD